MATKRKLSPETHKDVEIGQELFYVTSRSNGVIVDKVKIKIVGLDYVADSGSNSYNFSKLFFAVDDALAKAKSILLDDGLPD